MDEHRIRGRSEFRASDYLGMIARDAKALADVWRKIIDGYSRGIDDPNTDEEIQSAILHIRGLMHSQLYHYSKLEYFYAEVRGILGSSQKDEEHFSNFMVELEEMIERRNLAKD